MTEQAAGPRDAPPWEGTPSDGTSTPTTRGAPPLLPEVGLVPPGAPVPSRPRRPAWPTLLLAAVAAGLVLGALAAAASAPLRGPAPLAVTPLPQPGAGAPRAGAPAVPPAAQPPAPTAREPEGTRRGPLNGVIVSVEGDTIMVDTPEGAVRVVLGEATRLERVAPATRADLVPGQRIVVSGEAEADGAVAARAVQVVGP